MNILMINTHDIKGGAARAAYRLHQALTQADVSSTMVVRHKQSNDPSVVEIEDIYQGRSAFFDSLPSYSYKIKPHQLFSSAMLSNPLLLEYINNSDADVVHIHWIALGFMSLDDVQQIKKPLVFSLHDMWLFTGGCHYTQQCQAYMNFCRNCPTLQSSSSRDLSTLNFNNKIQLFATRKDITIVGSSRWIAEEAKRSSILRRSKIEHLPTPIDTNRYKPLSKHEARLKLKLPLDCPVIIFAADGGTKDPRKGYNYLKDILSGRMAEHELHLITFGNKIASQTKQGKHSIQHLPAIKDEEDIAMLLNAANLVVLPSVQENLSNLVLESLCCGTPVVAFDIGGNSDMIKHLDNGYLAQYPKSEDLAAGVIWGLSHAFEKNKIHDDMAKRFGYPVIAEKYITLYQSLQQPLLLSPACNLTRTLLNNIHENFEWTTTELEDWIGAIRQHKKPFYIYGFGILGKYLQTKLAAYCVAVIDKNYASYQDEYPSVNFLGLQHLEGLSNSLIIITILDPDQSVRKAIESWVHRDTKILSLLEQVNT